MAYADTEFYKTKYYGDTVPDKSLEKYLEKASDRIDNITFDRLVDGLPDNERAQTKVKKAVCAVADCLYQIDEVKKASMATVGTVTREDGTMTGKMVYPIVDKFIVQWEEQKKVYPKAVNLGSIF